MVVLEQITIVEAGALILIRVQGSHFLWRMVRRIVGVLAAVGRQELRADAAASLLDPDARPSAISPAALSAPAAGLFLEHVRYSGDPPPGPVRPWIAIDP